MNIERLKKLAGCPQQNKKLSQLNENVDIDKLQPIIESVYSLAEETAYNVSAPNNQAVTGDQIYEAIESIVEHIKIEAESLIETRHMG